MPTLRKLVGATTVVALCLGVAACTSDTDRPDAQDPSPSASSSPAGTEQADLRFAVYGTEDEIESYVDMANAFTKNNPNITVTVERAPDADAAMDNLENGFRTGDAPDLFLMEHEFLPELMAEKHTQPVDQLLEERRVDFGDGYQRGGLEAFSADTALQCMPHDVSPLVVYYNKRLLDLRSLVEVGDDPPNPVDGWTWEQFALAAHRMSHGRVNGVHIKPALDQLAPLIWSAGGDIVDDSGSPSTLTLATDGDTRSALEQVLTLVRDPRVSPTPAELERSSAVERFRRGHLGMILGTRALTPELRQAADLNFEVMPLPMLGRYRTITQMSGYCISSQTRHLDAAADFLAFAVGREGATITATSGYVVPANLQVAHSPAFIQPGKDPQNSFVFNEGVRRAERPPFVPQWPELTEEVRPLLERAFYAPVIDLDALLQQVDAVSVPILAPPEESPAAE